MENLIWFFLTINITLISVILWFLTFLGFYTNKNVFDKNSHTQFECGFKTTTNFCINLKLNSVISIIFLTLYEIEFIFMVPLLFVKTTFSNLYILIQPIFLFLIFITFFLDTKTNSVQWNY